MLREDGWPRIYQQWHALGPGQAARIQHDDTVIRNRQPFPQRRAFRPGNGTEFPQADAVGKGHDPGCGNAPFEQLFVDLRGYRDDGVSFAQHTIADVLQEAEHELALARTHGPHALGRDGLVQLEIRLRPDDALLAQQRAHGYHDQWHDLCAGDDHHVVPEGVFEQNPDELQEEDRHWEQGGEPFTLEHSSRAQAPYLDPVHILACRAGWNRLPRYDLYLETAAVQTLRQVRGNQLLATHQGWKKGLCEPIHDGCRVC